MNPGNDIDRSEQIRVIEAIDADDLAHAMFEAVRAVVPPYAAIPAAKMLEEVREHCRGQAQTTLHSLLAGTIPTEAELSFVRENAARRARQRMPLAALLHAYRIGYAVVWDRIRAEVRRTPVSIDAAVALADLCVGYVNAISVAASDGYLAEQQRGLVEQERTRAWLLESLLGGQTPRGDAEVLLSTLRLDARGTSYVLVVSACADDDPIETRELEERLRIALATLLPVVAAGDAPVLGGALNDRAVAMVVRPEVGDAAAWIQSIDDAAAAMPDGQRLAVGVSTGWPDLADVPRAYKEAVRAAGMARKDHRFVALSRTSLFDDLIALADATTYRLVPEWAHSFLDEDRRANGELSSTLIAYVQSELSVGRAAAELTVHPNTIRYRLHRIESITGGTLRSYTHLFDILASLRLLARRR